METGRYGLGGYMPARVIWGKNCVRQNAAVFAAFGKSCLIVTSATAAVKSGALADCEAALTEAGVRFSLFGRIEANPRTETCRAAGEAARACGADFIVGIGGGSAMDAAKAVAVYAANPAFGHADVYARSVPARALPVLLIGTTAGTGSEVTGVSVLTNSDTGLKKSISGADCYAKISFCDCKYTLGLPAGVTRSTGLDALAHAVESRLASTSNELSALYADRAIVLLRSFLKKLNSDPFAPTEEEREAWYAASVLAGFAINITGTCFPHTVGYHFTERYGVPHGFACAALMPLLLERAEKHRPEALGAVEIALDMPARALCALLAPAVRFDFTVDRAEAEAVAARWQAGVKNFDRSPGGFTAADAADALVAATSD